MNVCVQTIEYGVNVRMNSTGNRDNVCLQAIAYWANEGDWLWSDCECLGD